MNALRVSKPRGKALPLVRPTHEDLHALARVRGTGLVSVYLPLRATHPGARENALRLRAAREVVAKRLLAEGVAPEEAERRTALLARIAVEPRRWSRPAAGLAAFVGPDQAHAFALPEAVPERICVADSFALLGLAHALQRMPSYRVLALSNQRVAILEGDAAGLEERAYPGVPRSLEEALGSELEGRQLSTRTNAGPEAGRSAQFYASHGANDERARDLERFHVAVAAAVERALGTSRMPLVLATDESHAGRFRKHVRLPELLDEGASGNPAGYSAQDLHARCWPVVQRELARRADALRSEWERARHAEKGLTALDRILAAAASGRVRRLWVDAGSAVPGRLDPDGLRVVPCEGRDGDALEALASQVLAHGGDVIVAESEHMPAPASAAAELR